LEKAYDTAWKHGILQDLQEAGLKGLLPNFVRHFLEERRFSVRLGDTKSDEYQQEMGVPQGSILSPVLFNLKINKIVECLSDNVNSSLYVDDFLISYSGANKPTVERKIQGCLKKLETWCSENGFKFSESKTICVHFHNKRREQPEPDLRLNNKTITVKKEAKFLGLIFDQKLTFRPHIKYLKERCKKALNLIRVVASMEWGGDRTVLLRLYRSLIRSKLDYGSFIYGAARQSYIKCLDPVAHQGLRLALGAFRTSPVESLYAEAGEAPLYIRREKLALQYTAKLSEHPENPTHKAVFVPEAKRIFQNKENAIKSFGLRIGPALKDIGFKNNSIIKAKPPEKPPWTKEPAEVLLTLCKHKKEETCPEIYRSGFLEIREDHPGFQDVYTDGSKMDDKVAAAAVCGQHRETRRLPDGASVYSAELQAIRLALKIVYKKIKRNSIIFSDSKSSLQALMQSCPDHPYARELQTIIQAVKQEHPIRIVLCWIPSHIGIEGNERADQAAKDALSTDICPRMKVVSSDVKCAIRERACKRAQQHFDDSKPDNKLKQIQPKVNMTSDMPTNCRRDEVVLTRLKVGHTRYTNAYHLNQEEPPFCIGCHSVTTVKHILIDCVEYSLIRPRYYSAQSMFELFDTVPSQTIINFVKTIGLYKQI